MRPLNRRCDSDLQRLDMLTLVYVIIGLGTRYREKSRNAMLMVLVPSKPRIRSDKALRYSRDKRPDACEKGVAIRPGQSIYLPESFISRNKCTCALGQGS